MRRAAALVLACACGCASIPGLVSRLETGPTQARIDAAGRLAYLQHDRPGEVLQAVRPLIAAVEEGPGELREMALQALGEFGPAAVEAVPAILEVIRSGEEIGQVNALWALRRIHLRVKHVPMLVAALESDRDGLCETAATTLGMLGPGASQAVPALTKALGAEWFRTRWYAARALGYVGKDAAQAKDALVSRINDAEEDYRVRISSADAFVKIGLRDAAAVPGLVQILKMDGQFPRRTALRALAAIGPEASGAFAGVAVALRDEDCFVRENAAIAMAAISPDARGLAALADMIARETRSPTKHDAIRALGAFGSDALPLLRRMLSQEDDRHIAALALGEVGPAALDDLAGLLDERWLGYSALRAIGSMGPEATRAAPDLRKRLSKPGSRHSSEAAVALVRIGDEEAGFRAIGGWLDGDRADKLAGLQVVVRLGKKAERFGPVVERHLVSADIVVRKEAAVAMARLGQTEKGVGVLVELLALPGGDEVIPHRLYQLGAAAAPAAPALAEVLKTRSPLHWQTAARALHRIGSPAVPALVDLLISGNVRARRRACLTLYNIGWEARAAVPALTEALNDNDTRVRKLASFALSGIAAVERPGRRSFCSGVSF